MITPQQRANHNMHAINEIEHLLQLIRKLDTTKANDMQHLFDSCFNVDDDLKYNRALRRTYNECCKTWDNLNMD